MYISLKKSRSELDTLSDVDKCFHGNVEFTCLKCGQEHDKLWTIKRKMVETFGHFPVFRINGSLAVVDGTLPHTVDKLPRDAQEITPERASELWHKNSHYFG